MQSVPITANVVSSNPAHDGGVGGRGSIPDYVIT